MWPSFSYRSAKGPQLSCLLIAHVASLCNSCPKLEIEIVSLVFTDVYGGDL